MTIVRRGRAGGALALLLVASPVHAAAGGYGHVSFANSGAPAAQADFLDGLARLHDFEYSSAAAAFRRAEAADSTFAMAYWGEAMTFNHPIWMEQDVDSARAALAKLGPTPALRRAKARTDREKGYLDAVETLYGTDGADSASSARGLKEERDARYERAMAALHARYPDDVDATAFYGLSILGTAHAGRDAATYMRAAAVLEEAWADHREHPGLVHYLIHSYDDPVHAPLGLRAARIYARIAPDAGHAQHMVSHIFLPLGMWQEAVDANRAAMAAVNRQRRSEGKGPAHSGHYISWLEYAYLQLGRRDEAKRLVAECREEALSRMASDGAMHAGDPDRGPMGSFANMRLRYMLDTQSWTGDVAGWPLPHGAGPGARLDDAFANALAAIARGRVADASHAVDDMDAAGREVSDREVRRGTPDPTDRVRPQILLLETRGLLAEQARDISAADSLLRQAVTLEESLPIAFGPPAIEKPPRELYGEFLLRQGRVDEARAQLEKAIARTPGRLAVVRDLAETQSKPAGSGRASDSSRSR